MQDYSKNVKISREVSVGVKGKIFYRRDDCVQGLFGRRERKQDLNWFRWSARYV